MSTIKGYERARWQHHPAGGIIVYSGEPGRIFITWRHEVFGPFTSMQEGYDAVTKANKED